MIIHGNYEAKDQLYAVIDSVVKQIVRGQKSFEVSSASGLAVEDLIARFAKEDKLEEAVKEAENAKEIAYKALEREAELKQQVHLKAGGLVGQLKQRNESLKGPYV